MSRVGRKKSRRHRLMEVGWPVFGGGPPLPSVNAATSSRLLPKGNPLRWLASSDKPGYHFHFCPAELWFAAAEHPRCRRFRTRALVGRWR